MKDSKKKDDKKNEGEKKKVGGKVLKDEIKT